MAGTGADANRQVLTVAGVVYVGNAGRFGRTNLKIAGTVGRLEVQLGLGLSLGDPQGRVT